MKPFWTVVGVFVVFGVLAMANAEDETGAKLDKLQPSELGTILNVHSFGQDVLCGQPTRQDLAEAKRRGIKVIVTLREQGEIDLNEAGVAKGLGLTFHRIAFRSPDSLTDTVFNQVRKVLISSKQNKDPVMLHCGSANRVGAVWAAHRVLDYGLSIEQAIEEAQTVGLRTDAYRDKAIDYINRQQVE